MYEYHSWITVRYHAHDTNASLQSECWHQVQSLLTQFDFPLKASLQYNGLDTIHIAGHHNHASTKAEAFLRRIAEIAPGSYGIMHIHDDEDPKSSNSFKKLTLKKGEIEETIDNDLSPYIPVLEDEYDQTRED